METIIITVYPNRFCFVTAFVYCNKEIMKGKVDDLSVLELKGTHTWLQNGPLCKGLWMSEHITGIGSNKQIQHAENVESCSVSYGKAQVESIKLGFN